MIGATHVDVITFPAAEPRKGLIAGEQLRRRHLAVNAPVASVEAIWSATDTPSSGVPTTERARALANAVSPVPVELESQLLAVLTRPLAPDESHQVGDARREREVYAVLGSLDVAQAYQLGRRFDAARPGDALVVALGRMVSDRRQRVRAFISDTRRRLALGK